MLGITDDSLLQISTEGGELRIKPVKVTDHAGSDWIKELYDLFASVREQTAKHSEKDINTAIDEAVQAVRKAHECTGCHL